MKSMSLPAYALPLLAAVIGNILYHLSSKSAPAAASPFAILSMVYMVGFLGSATLALTLDGTKPATLLPLLAQPAILILALAVILIEVGFLYAYRAGAPVSTSSLVVNSTVALVLAGIGVLVFREGLNWRMALGMIITIVGVALIATSKSQAPS
jgi:drug/metabolite transporter (DMT)-like permease